MHEVVKVEKGEPDTVVLTTPDFGEAVDKAQALGRAYRKAYPGDYSVTFKVR